jgi:hypothetical protein
MFQLHSYSKRFKLHLTKIFLLCIIPKYFVTYIIESTLQIVHRAEFLWRPFFFNRTHISTQPPFDRYSNVAFPLLVTKDSRQRAVSSVANSHAAGLPRRGSDFLSSFTRWRNLTEKYSFYEESSLWLLATGLLVSIICNIFPTDHKFP